MAREAALYGLGVRSDAPIAAFAQAPRPRRVDLDWSLGRMPEDFDGIEADAWRLRGTGLSGDDEAPVRVHHAPTHRLYRFDYADGTRVVLDDRGTRVWATHAPGATLEDTATYLLGPVMGFVLRLRGVPCLHASAVSFEGRAVAFAGHAGRGKSTAAATLALRGHRVLTEDVLPLRHDAGRFEASPGYPLVRLWPSTVRSLFGAEEALPRITPNWDKRFLALEDRGVAGFERDALPLGAVCVLEERRARAGIERLSPSKALVDLVAHAYSATLLDRGMRATEFERLGRLVAEVPVFRVNAPASIAELGDFLEAVLPRVGAREPEGASV